MEKIKIAIMGFKEFDEMDIIVYLFQMKNQDLKLVHITVYMKLMLTRLLKFKII